MNFKTIGSAVLIFSFVLFLFYKGGKQSSTSRPIMVFAAASLTEALEEIGQQYQKITGRVVQFNFAGSNVLAHQIIKSNRADLFISANEYWMDQVMAKKRMVVASRTALLTNGLVLVAHQKSLLRVKDQKDLCELTFRRVALGQPEAVPAGRYAVEWLKSVDCGEKSLWEVWKKRVVPALDVKSALNYAERDSSLIAVVYQTDSQTSDRVRVLYAVPPSEAPKITYSLGMTKKTSDSNDEASSFFEFVQTEEARIIFKQHGFSPLF